MKKIVTILSLLMFAPIAAADVDVTDLNYFEVDSSIMQEINSFKYVQNDSGIQDSNNYNRNTGNQAVQITPAANTPAVKTVTVTTKTTAAKVQRQNNSLSNTSSPYNFGRSDYVYRPRY
ncbi:MAG: hypothetical protein LBK53_04775 [Heliobacteriaceae bacterium]|jgi:hypothetical protein|nr:hypothetical protein [Heliobacteriaceae bacterium]